LLQSDQLLAFGDRRQVNAMQTRYNVLFLRTGNSARSIMAEAIQQGKPNFTVYSAGSQPAGAGRSETLKQLELAGLPTDGLRSKNWEEFAKPGASQMNFVFTVCDNAARELSIWPGQPIGRISLFLCLPLSSLDQLAVKKEIDRIGQR
jgi:arsenate reductase